MWSVTVSGSQFLLINLLCDSGAAKYRRQTGSLIYLVFYMHLLLYVSITIFQISNFPEPLISTTTSRCPVNFINIAAIIVAFWLSEYDSKLRRDFRFHDKRGHPRCI